MNNKSWRSETKSSTRRGYGSRWQKARASFLRNHPLCVYCERQGRVTAATVLDHIKPHEGDKNLFWERNNWQSLCSSCHSSVKQRLERSGRFAGCDVNGLPLDSNHHWNLS